MRYKEKIRIIITGDHEMFRSGLCRFLNDREDFEAVGEAFDLVEQLKPDIAIIDIAMPHIN